MRLATAADFLFLPRLQRLIAETLSVLFRDQPRVSCAILEASFKYRTSALQSVNLLTLGNNV